ncbi:MAG: DUF4922 domain-containing protein [Smithellaceae bacterium]
MENQIFAIFPGIGQMSLSELCANLLEEQKKNWPGLAAAQERLGNVQTRLLSCTDYEVCVQFNPARAVNSGAAVDKESIKNRPCFLCALNLSRPQKGILYQKYLILCNPMPIFEKHFTIAHLQHQPQEIVESLGGLLDLTADMSPDFIVFYNGPACGASAPDHLHFQAIPADTLPLQKSFPGHFRIIKDTVGKFYCGEGIKRAVLVLEGSDKDLLLRQFDCLIKAAQNIIPVSGEPMINVLCSYEDCVWRIMIFFRSKHRPDAFYAEGEQRIFVSPGTIDMAGVIITPRAEDFQRLDADQIAGIYREVSLPEEKLKLIIKGIN